MIYLTMITLLIFFECMFKLFDLQDELMKLGKEFIDSYTC